LAAAIADSAGSKAQVEFKPKETPRYYPIDVSWKTVKADRKVPLLSTINDRVFALDKRIVKCNIFLGDESRYILVVRSDGRMVCDFQPMTFTFVNCVAEQNGRREDGGFGLSGRNDTGFSDKQAPGIAPAELNDLNALYTFLGGIVSEYRQTFNITSRNSGPQGVP
jgi:TldD protein